MELPVPKWVEAPITSSQLEGTVPSAAALKLLQNVVKQIITKGETFSVTNSPMLCPAGKNYLLTVKPYFWESPVGSGCWEHRDGKRNPVCDRPQGQKQLQGLATVVRPLAWAWAYTQDAAALAAAENLLKIFFIDEDTRMAPEILYAQVNLGDRQLKGDKLFVVAVRHLILVDQAVTLLPPSPVVDTVKQWIKTQLEWMQSSPQGAEARSARNNVEVWYHALHASHLATFDSDQAAIYATEQLNWYLSLPPPALMAKELSRSRPRHYVLFTLEPLFLLTRIAAGTGPLKPVYAGNLGISLDFARDVPPGVIEYESDSDPRYGAQLAWFERILARWTASAVPDGGPDGSHWDGGWNQAARLAWAMI